MRNGTPEKPIILSEKPEVLTLSRSHMPGAEVVITKYRKFVIDPTGDMEIIIDPHKPNEERVTVREIL